MREPQAFDAWLWCREWGVESLSVDMTVRGPMYTVELDHPTLTGLMMAWQGYLPARDERAEA